MAKIKIFITVGRTPQAVANALAAHLLDLSPTEPVDCYFLMGSAEGRTFPTRTSSDSEEILEIFQENQKYLSKLQNIQVNFHPDSSIDIYEHDLIKNVELIVSQVSSMIEENNKVIFEITAGRKAMTGSALIGATLLRQKHPSCSFEIAYYWLKQFTKDILQKRLYELGFDAYKSVLTSLEDLDKLVRKVQS
ncbi:MAG: hypothetical protein ACFE96_08705 [Candidatus Hermodarchaeota archaeon]